MAFEDALSSKPVRMACNKVYQSSQRHAGLASASSQAVGLLK